VELIDRPLAANLWCSTRLYTRAYLVHFCILPIKSPSLNNTPCHCTCTPTTLKYTAPVCHPMSVIFYKISVGVLTLLATGCRTVGFNIMVTRLSSCGSLQPDANSDSPTLGLTIGSTAITPCKAVRDLVVYIDADLTRRTHVHRTVSCCFATCASCAPSDARCRYLCFSYWSLHLFSAGWIIATVC